MKMELILSPRLEQRLILAPQIIQSIEILQLPLLALQERIEQEQLENPVLEVVEGAEEEPSQQQEHTDQLDDPKRDEKIESGEDFRKLDNMDYSWTEYFSQAGPAKRYSDQKDEKLEAIQNSPGRPESLQDYLINQLRLLETDSRTHEIAVNIINNLDRDGRLRYSLSEICSSMDDPPAEEEAEAALKIVQLLDPPGVGARTLQECLLLQLDKRDPDHQLQKEIVLNHLEDIEANRLPKIAKETGNDMEKTQEAVDLICTLSPAPGRLYDNEVVPYAVPDVNVNLIEGEYFVALDDKALPRLRISSDYELLMKQQERGSSTRDYIKKKMDSARWLMDAIQQRRTTLLKVTREIVKAQEGFLEQGVSALKPLKMQEVADATSMHVSTVSRAIRDKYVQTPRGILPMKAFFTGGMQAAEGRMESWDAVKQRIADIIENEDKLSPLSDEEITRKLQETGLEIARRTVTKYRKALSLPSSRQRRRY